MLTNDEVAIDNLVTIGARLKLIISLSHNGAIPMAAIHTSKVTVDSFSNHRASLKWL